MAPPILTISTARQKFFALFQTVTGHRGRKVVITSRGSENHAVLVGESYLNELEAAAKRLRDIESGKAKPSSDYQCSASVSRRHATSCHRPKSRKSSGLLACRTKARSSSRSSSKLRRNRPRSLTSLAMSRRLVPGA